MAASPHIAAGGYDPFMDLLFSPRAAFIWDNTKRVIAWMNAAARSKFGLSLQDLPEALPTALTRRLTQCFAAFSGGKKAQRIVRLKIAGSAAFDCSLELLKLAGGNDGLIVAEVETREENASKPLQPPFRRNDIASAAAAHEASKNTREKAGSSFTPVPQLTAEELRSFKAIGRKVRRLCREKQRTAARARVEPFPPLPAPKPLPSSVQPAPALLFSAFDLVLFLDANLRAVGSEGRPQRLGWRKSYLNRKPAAQLLAPAEQVIFNRMVKRLEDKAIQSCRNTLVILDEAGGSIPCRAILGRWAAGDAAFFLALVSLKVPQRLKRLNPPVLNTPQAPRLAA